MRRRVLAWIALIVFLALFINILFIHYRVTESATILMLYVLFFFYYKKRQDRTDSFPSVEKDNSEPDEANVSLEDKNKQDGEVS